MRSFGPGRNQGARAGLWRRLSPRPPKRRGESTTGGAADEKNTVVTPPFPGYTSGHSTYSRPAAEGSRASLFADVGPPTARLSFPWSPSTARHAQEARVGAGGDQSPPAGRTRLTLSP